MGQAKKKKLKQQKEAAGRSAPASSPAGEAKETTAYKFIEHVKINCDDVVRRNLQQDARFLKLYWNMQRDLGDRAYGREVCLHEAGHSVLMEQDGMTNVRFLGPDIIFDPAKNDFVGTSARAVADDQPNAIVTDEYIFKITSHMAAGAVALRKLRNIEGYAGDEGDLADFARRYAANPPKSKETAEQFWKRAQDAVAARLDDPETRQKVLDRADEYFRLLYPLG